MISVCHINVPRICVLLHVCKIKGLKPPYRTQATSDIAAVAVQCLFFVVTLQCSLGQGALVISVHLAN